MSVLMRRRRVLAVKHEATAGTAESLTADDAALNVFDLTINPNIPMQKRPKQGGFGRLAASPEGYAGQLMFSMELSAPSATPLWARRLLPAVGMGKDPDSASTTTTSGAIRFKLEPIPPGGTGGTQHTVTLAAYEDGLLKKLAGAMGNLVLTFEAGKKAMLEFTFTGKWVTPSDADMLGPTYPTDKPLRMTSSALAIGAWSPKVQQLRIDLGNQIYLREDTSDSTGFSHAVIGNREVSGSINPEAGLVATKDVYGELLSMTQAAISWACAAGDDSATFYGTNLQWTNPQEGDRNGVQTDDIEFDLNGDDLEVLLARSS